MHIQPLKPPRLQGDVRVLDALSIVSEGNPGCLSVFTQVLRQSEDVGLSMIYAADKTGFTGSLIWGLFKDYAKTPMRAAAILISCAELGLPTPQELLRDVEASHRTRADPSPIIEVFLAELGQQPLFKGCDLSKPMEG